MKPCLRSKMSAGQFWAGRWMLATLLLLGAVCGLRAQSGESYEARRTQALELCKSHRYIEAYPILEKLHEEKSDDKAVLENLSYAMIIHAATLTDKPARKQERARARKLAEEAKALGPIGNLTKMVTEIREDGEETAFSDKAEIQAVMEEGERAFAKGELDEALDAYQRALAIDPQQYHAALFLGDVNYRKKNHEQAARWFQRAIEIDPNIETAYRYWGDDLMGQGRKEEARDKFMEAVVAEPYANRAWMGLAQWAKAEKFTLSHPAIKPLGKVEDTGKNNTTITIDPSSLNPQAKDDGTDAWFAYTLFRAGWHTEEFRKKHTTEKEYRHSLAEEMDGFQGVVNQVNDGLKNKKIKHLDPALAALLKISEEGLLESFILISRPDQGIAMDYPAYRNAHREKIRQYLREWILHAGN